MGNRIKEVHISNGRLDPTEAQIWISVHPEILTSTTQVRARLMGPRCPYASTVEVAYPFREHSRQYESEGTPSLILRAIIPEPNFWEPETPFLYQGPVELWQKGQHCDTVQISYGLRTIHLGPRGLRLNGSPLTLRGVFRSAYSEVEVRSLHQANYNNLVVPAGPDFAHGLETADRFGFFVLGRITTKADLAYDNPRNDHPSWLGWLVKAGLFGKEGIGPFLPTILSDPGIELTQVPGELPKGISFVAGPENLLRSLGEICLPKLILRKGPERDSLAKGIADLPDFLGWVEE